MLEMYRRDQFKQDLLVEQCLEVISIEERLREIDSLLEATQVARRQGVGVRCTCGAPIVWGSHFCANCGTAVPESTRSGDGESGEGDQTMYQVERSGDPWEG